MIKKISSVSKIENVPAHLKIGTMDKKNPTVIYFDGGFYIKPMQKKNHYYEDLEVTESELKDIVEKYLKNSKIFNKKFMFFTDISKERVLYNKKSFLSFQIYLKPTKETLSKIHGFKDIISYIDNMDSFISDFKNTIEKNGFETSKTKI